jgi:hypothetical protein
MSPSQQASIIQTMKADGVKWWRMDAGGDSHAGVVKQLIAAGINVEAIVNGTNPSDTSSNATADVQALWPLGVHVYEIINEPNLRGISAANYTAILKASYTTIKSIEPTATVLVGGLGPGNPEPIPYLEDMYADGAQGYFDGMNTHPYSFPDLPSQTNDSWNPWAYLPQMHQIMVDHGDGNKQIWLTEFGAPTDQYGVPFEAESITQAFQKARTWSWAGPLFIFSWWDNSYDGGLFGLFDSNGVPKTQALNAFIAAAA